MHERPSLIRQKGRDVCGDHRQFRFNLFSKHYAYAEDFLKAEDETNEFGFSSGGEGTLNILDQR